jgi:glycosyltransferase involved in cell wall biosynthesis
LLFFGRIVAYKGLDHLLRAYELLLDRGVKVELVIAGSGSLAPYADLLCNLPVAVRNEWLSDAAIADLLTATDVAVLPYVEASQSGVAASAYAAGRAVVATPMGGLVEQVEHGTTGVLACDMSVGALASAIRTLVDDPDLFDRCAEGALAHAQGRLSWRHSADVVCEAVASVYGREPRPRV